MGQVLRDSGTGTSASVFLVCRSTNSALIFVHVLFLPEGQTYDALEPSKEQCYSGSRGAVDRTCFNLFVIFERLIGVLWKDCQYRCYGRSSLDMESAASRLANMSNCLLYETGFDAGTLLAVLTMTRYSAVRDVVNKSSDSLTQGHAVPAVYRQHHITSRSGKYRTEVLARWSTWRSCLAFPQILQANAVIVLHIGPRQLPCFRFIIHYSLDQLLTWVVSKQWTSCFQSCRLARWTGISVWKSLLTLFCHSCWTFEF